MNPACTRSLFLALAAGLVASCANVREDLVGGVYEYDGHYGIPLAGAKIHVECLTRRAHLHGAEKIKDLTYGTDQHGKYTIPGADLIRCDFLITRATKEGYEHFYETNSPEKIPSSITLVRKEQAAMAKLRWYGEGGGLVRVDVPTWVYIGNFERFYRSINIAKTSLEKKYVADRYCAQLMTIWRSMSPDERAYAEKRRFYCYQCGISMVDHQIVDRWCANQP